MSKLIEVTDFFNKSKFLINTRFVIKCISIRYLGENATEVTLQYGDQIMNYKVKEKLDELYHIVNYG